MNMTSVPFGPLTSASVQVLPSVPGRLKSTAFHPKSQTVDWAAIGVSLPDFIVDCWGRLLDRECNAGGAVVKHARQTRAIKGFGKPDATGAGSFPAWTCRGTRGGPG